MEYHRLLHLAAVATLLGASPVAAQNWPIRPVTMVVTFAAGSGDDVLARIIAPSLSNFLGQQVVIENIGGAGGMTGASRVAKAAPDGYQLVLGGTGTFAANQTLYRKPLYNATTDFVPVALVAEQPMVLIARKDLPVANLQEFIRYAKPNQAIIQYGSGGPGSATHLACALLSSTTGLKGIHIPYRSTALALQDMIGGRIEYACPIISSALSQIEGNQVKAIAVLSKARSPAVPNLASAHEQGLADFDVYIWNGIFVPKDTPPAIVEKLHDATVAAMNIPAVQARIRELGGAIVSAERRSPEYLRKFVETEIQKWAGPIKAAGVALD